MTTKNEVLEAGKAMAARSTPAQQQNHNKVLAWIETLPASEIPDYAHHSEGAAAGATLSYKMLIRAWCAKNS